MAEFILETKPVSAKDWTYIDTFPNRQSADRALRDLKKMWKEHPPYAGAREGRTRAAPMRRRRQVRTLITKTGMYEHFEK